MSPLFTAHWAICCPIADADVAAVFCCFTLKKVLRPIGKAVSFIVFFCFLTLELHFSTSNFRFCLLIGLFLLLQAQTLVTSQLALVYTHQSTSQPHLTHCHSLPFSAIFRILFTQFTLLNSNISLSFPFSLKHFVSILTATKAHNSRASKHCSACSCINRRPIKPLVLPVAHTHTLAHCQVAAVDILPALCTTLCSHSCQFCSYPTCFAECKKKKERKINSAGDSFFGLHNINAYYWLKPFSQVLRIASQPTRLPFL